MIKAVIYDVDGTLIDSELPHIMAWDDALKRYGSALAHLSEDSRKKMPGSKTISIATNMVSELKLQISPSELVNAVEDVMLAQVKAGVEPMPGATGSVIRFHEAGLLLGVGTAMKRDYVDYVLENLGAPNVFTAVVTGDQTQHGKPDPETYLTVAKRLGVNPHESVVLEDANTGILSAKSAGCYCIAITNPAVPNQDTSKADRLVSSWDEVTTATFADLTG